MLFLQGLFELIRERFQRLNFLCLLIQMIDDNIIQFKTNLRTKKICKVNTFSLCTRTSSTGNVQHNKCVDLSPASSHCLRYKISCSY